MPIDPLPLSRSLSRRSVLAGLGSVVGGAGAVGALTAEGALAAGKPGKRGKHRKRNGGLPRKVDVVVVGAGISGLVAAREVLGQGHSVAVLEARDRVGGRVLNHALSTGDTIESGGAFIGPTQTHIAALAAELGVETFLEYNTGSSVYVSSTTGRTEYTGTVPPDPTILADAAVLLQMIDSYAAEIDVSAPWAHPRAAEWDAMTLGEYIRKTSVNATGVENLVRSWSQPGFGADPGQLSFLFTLWYVACSGDEQNTGTFSRNSDTANGAQERRFVGGSQLVPLRLAATLPRGVVHRSSPVRAIKQTRTRKGAEVVRVKTRKGVVEAKRVIVAVPPPMVLQITFSPAMPDRRVQLMRHLEMGQLMKCDAVYATPFWRDAGLNGFGVNDSGAVRVAFDNTPPDGGPGVLLAFVGGATWREYGVQSVEQRRAAVLQGFAAMFGPQALDPIDYVEHDWTKERWTGGGPTAIHGPGTLREFGPEIRVPHGRVHWAGTETATYWTGYMDGAVRSGERAAVEVLDALPAPRRKHKKKNKKHQHRGGGKQ